MKTDKNTSLQELFVQMGYDLQVICDEFADLRNKPTGTIDDYLKQFGFIRRDVRIYNQFGWGDAIYIKQN